MILLLEDSRVVVHRGHHLEHPGAQKLGIVSRWIVQNFVEQRLENHPEVRSGTQTQGNQVASANGKVGDLKHRMLLEQAAKGRDRWPRIVDHTRGCAGSGQPETGNIGYLMRSDTGCPAT